MANEEFYVGQIFEGSYPPAAAIACNQNGWYIDVIGTKRYEIKAIPEPPAPTEEEQRLARASAYQAEVDPITAHISRLKDKEQTEEVIAEINALMLERDEKVEEIKARFPYPTDPIFAENNEIISAPNAEITEGESNE